MILQELFMKEDLPTVMFGRKTLDESTEDVVILCRRCGHTMGRFYQENKYVILKNIIWENNADEKFMFWGNYADEENGDKLEKFHL